MKKKKKKKKNIIIQWESYDPLPERKNKRNKTELK